MNQIEEQTLSALGWSQFFQDQVSSENTHLPARITRQDRSGYHLVSNGRLQKGSLPGIARLETSSKAELPTVGDWVLVSPADNDNPDTVIIQETLKRATKFSRKEAGEKYEEQVVAANIDTVFIVTGLDDNFNAKRIERYLLLTWASGATPIIVLNKADLCDDIESKLEEIAHISMGTPAVVISATHSEGIDALKAWQNEGQTIAVLGSSGVGKSTLINLLIGYDHFKTGDVRSGDSKGRHTTTHRELCVMENGGLIIDTPGMREIQFWLDENSSLSGFNDIQEIALQCRFNDCRHGTEPRCAIKAAIADNSLNQERYDSYLKYQREISFFTEQKNASLRLEKKNERKKTTKSYRKRPTKRD